MSRWARLVALVALIAAGTPAFPDDGELVPLVPWKVLQPGEVIASPLVLFWIPSSPDAMRRSAMLTSDDLTQFSDRCVAMRVVRFDDETRLATLQIDEDLPAAVLTDRDGNILGTVRHRHGRLVVSEIEDLVRDELGEREAQADELLDKARKLAEDGDVEGAQELYGKVAEARCLCPRQAKAAAKALKKLARK